jgi:transposase
MEVIDGLDLTAMSKSYRGTGSASYHSAPLLGLLIYGYASGVFSSRKLERATHDSVAFCFVAANDHPDHDTIATFRRRFLPEIEVLFVKVLLLAREMGVLRLGTAALDGTKIHANASRHSALSYEHAGKIEAQLKAEAADFPRDHSGEFGLLGWTVAELMDVSTSALIAPTRRARPWPASSRACRTLQ